MKFKDILYTKKELESIGYSIENNIIEGADVSVIGHFGNAVSLNIYCSNCCIYHDRNDTQHLGHLMKWIVELLDLTDEDGYHFFSKMKNIPIRIVCDGEGWGSKVVGFGNFIKDKFIIVDDLTAIDEFE